MDADDIALPDRLNDQVNFLMHHPEICLVGGAFELIITNARVIRTIQPPLEDAEIRTLMLRFNPMCHPAVAMRRDIALACGGYRRQLLDADDYDLWLRMAERSQLANLDKVLLRYRIHPGQVSIQNMRHQTLCVLAARVAAERRRRGRPDPLESLEEITEPLVEALGVTPTEIDQSLVGVHWYWIDILRDAYPEWALRMVENFVQSPIARRVNRSVLADVWLEAAGLHYAQGRLRKALLSMGRGILVRPIIAGRPIKNTFVRLVAALGS
jgi:hypothetical protein